MASKLDKFIESTATGLDGEIVFLTNHDKGWHAMFKNNSIDLAYKTTNNYHQYCYLNYLGIDATGVFLSEIKQAALKETINKLKSLP